MIFEPTAISDVIVIKPNIYKDERGFFMETYQREEYSSNGINVRFVHDNHSGSEKVSFEDSIIKFRIHKANLSVLLGERYLMSRWI